MADSDKQYRQAEPSNHQPATQPHQEEQE